MGVTGRDLVRLVNFAPGLWRYLGHRLTLDEARRELQRRLLGRESNFLRLLKGAVYENPRSPYLRLLQWADCEYDDVERMVRSHGLESTLEALHDAGVYVTFDEYKGRAPIVRYGRSLAAQPEDFNNPLMPSPFFYGKTGGSTGASVRIPLTWEYHQDHAVNVMLFEHAHDLIGTRFAFWYSHPTGVPLRQTLLSLRYGRVPDAWFGPPAIRRENLSHRAFVRYFVLAARMAGRPVPVPTPVDLHEAEVVARWAAETRDRHGAAKVYGFVSELLRVALAATDADLDLTGVTFVGGGEAPTPGKVRAITSTGAQWIPIYNAAEAGSIGVGCANPLDENDLHLQTDRLAVIQRPQAVPGTDLTVDAFCFTSLLMNVTKLLLNTETDDYGTIECRPCGCPLAQLGLVDHVRHVRSYRKLTGEGFTLVGSDIERVLEDVLPARFGGSPLDYQLVEEEDQRGLTRLRLVISPRLRIDDEHAVVTTVLTALKDVDAQATVTAKVWERAGTLQVLRREPARTGAGKLMPLHMARNQP